MRLGIGAVRTVGEDLAKLIAVGRPYADVEDLARRCTLTRAQLEALATAGALAPRSGVTTTGARSGPPVPLRR